MALTAPSRTAQTIEPRVRSGELPAIWAGATGPAECGIDSHTVAAQADKPDADPFDILCGLAFNAPVLTCRQRANRLKQQQAAFFTFCAPEAPEILNDPLESQVDALKRLQTETAAELAALLPAILDKAFKGAL